MISNSLRACYVAQSLVIGADDKVDGELKVRAVVGSEEVHGQCWIMWSICRFELAVGCNATTRCPLCLSSV